MSYTPNNANGSATSANSAPVVIASDQATVATKLVDGTNSAGVFVPGTPNAAANAIAVAGTTESHTFSVSAVQAGTTYDAGNCAWVSVHILTQYTGTTPTITFQTSNDGANWVSTALMYSSASPSAQITTTATGAAILYSGPLAGRYFRLNFTGAYSSGTATGVITFSTLPRVMPGTLTSVLQNGAWGVGLAAQTTGGYSSNAISTATTTTVKSGAGTLHTISILGGTAGAIDVYDNTAGSGTKLVPTFTPGSVTTPATLTFDVAFATGLTIVTGAATLLQVSYK